MGSLDKLIKEDEAFEDSIRHMPLAEQNRLREKEYQRRSKASEITRKTVYVGAVTFIPALVWCGLQYYHDTVLEHFQSCIGLVIIPIVAMLATEYYLRKKHNEGS